MLLPHAACTVVIPCYDGELYLEAAVRSVQAQTFRDYHLVLVDDASRDGTRLLARRLAAEDPRITVVELPRNLGRSAARNRGTEATRGPYVAFLDQDDTYHPDFLYATVDALARLPDLDAVKVLPSISIPIDPVHYDAVTRSLATTMLLRRRAFQFVGGWPEGEVFRQHPGGCEDIAFQDLFGYCFNVGLIEKRLYNYTCRPGNALEQFLNRSSVLEGKLVFLEGFEADRQVTAEVRRLTGLLRQRVRDFVTERLGSVEAYLPPSARPPGFARLPTEETKDPGPAESSGIRPVQGPF